MNILPTTQFNCFSGYLSKRAALIPFYLSVIDSLSLLCTLKERVVSILRMEVLGGERGR